MTDLHTHILPGIDDGAIDEGVSSEQMKSLLEQGVDKVVFTSHYYGRKRSPKQFLEARADAFRRIKDLIPEGMETYLGAEVHFAAEMAASDESICSMAIGDTRYILAELPFTTAWNKGLWRRLEDFIISSQWLQEWSRRLQRSSECAAEVWRLFPDWLILLLWRKQKENCL